MRSELSDLCYYVKEKTLVSDLTSHNYVSTENLKPNKAGCDEAPGLPSIAQTQGYSAGDVLVSNIRPYFKKICYARNNGGCSNDVLVFRAKEGVDPLFLYYVLADDNFFAYSTATSKGTKMPRGDKTAIMKYVVPNFNRETQRKISGILGRIDDKIAVNEQINQNLEQQAQALFKSWFVDFEPFGGIMPSNWACRTFGDVCQNIRERTNDNSHVVLSAVSTGELQPSTEFFTKQVFSKDTSKYLKVPTKSFAYNPARVNIGSIGLNMFAYEGCVSPVYVVFEVEDEYEAYFNYLIKTPAFREEVKIRASGSVRQSLNYGDLALIELIYPDKDYAQKFNDFFWFIQNKKKQISNESASLTELRDTLLPRLMSGELDVSDLEL